MERRLTDVRGLATYLHLPPPTIYSWICRGKLPDRCIVRLGGRMLRFDLAEIDAWVNAQRAS